MCGSTYYFTKSSIVENSEHNFPISDNWKTPVTPIKPVKEPEKPKEIKGLTAKTYSEALTLSKENKKLALIIFTSKNCSACQAMKSTFEDPKVKELMDKYAVCFVDTNTMEGSKVARKYKINSIPAILIIDHREETIKFSQGRQNSSQFTNWLNSVNPDNFN